MLCSLGAEQAPNLVSLHADLDHARQDLLDLSLRNTLLNCRILQSKGVEIVDEIPAEVFRIMVINSKPMSFLPAPETTADTDGEHQPAEELWGVMLEQPEEEEVNADGVALRHVDGRLQTAHTSAMLQKRLLNTFYTARTHVEEQGVNILFLALGMLQWYESERSEIERLAPLVLVPVELYRTTARTRFRARYTEEDIGNNVSLAAKLKSDLAITLPTIGQADDLDIQNYFDQVEKAVSSQPRWTVDKSAIALSFFSFSRFVMYNDLDAENWPGGDKPGEHGILRAILQDGFTQPALEIKPNAMVDDYVSPKDSFQVVDADSSQTLAIINVNKGRNLVVQGPPGTGKSQTITNLIAEALGQNKTVLFVAEKMAALEVVKRRLDQVGLGNACLELHSHKANKKAFLEELRRTTELGRPKIGDYTADMQVLLRNRDRLNEYSKSVNTSIGGSGVTPYQAYGRLLHLRGRLSKIQTPSLDGLQVQTWTKPAALGHLAKVEELQTLLGRIGVPVQHPFWGSQVSKFLPADRRQFLQVFLTADKAVRNLHSKAGQLAEHVGLENPISRQGVKSLQEEALLLLEAPLLVGVRVEASEWLTNAKDIEEAMETGTLLASLHLQGDKWLISEAWTQDVQHIRTAYILYGSKWWRSLSGPYRRADTELTRLSQGNLSKKPNFRLKLVEKVLEAQRLQPIFSRHEPLMRQLFGSQWRGLESDWDTLGQTASWMADLLRGVEQQKLSSNLITYLSKTPNKDLLSDLSSAVEKSLDDYTSAVETAIQSLKMIEDLRFGKGGQLINLHFLEQWEIFKNWVENIDRLQEAVTLNHIASGLFNDGLETVVRVAINWPGAKEYLVELVERAWYEELVDQAIRTNPELNVFNGKSHELLIDKFWEADLLSFQINRGQLAHNHWQHLPQAMGGGQLGILKREFAKKRRHLPIRKLMSQAGNAIQAIKPIFMMSPPSIAMFLPPGVLHFDLVIFDEASQVRPVESFGAILRGRQVVVVGDSRQLPPSNFFRQFVEVDEEEGSPTADLESVLGLFSAQGAPQCMLRWHYRSRHESLIAVSNYEFYENKLVVFPSPDAQREEVGIAYHYLPDAVYDRGSSRTNRKEAMAVAEAVMAHARTKSQLTLGVAAFSVAQMHAIQDQLEVLRRQDASTEQFFNDHPHEPFFVKNLENVQGDERDVIFISIGYGRAADGRVTMNFGPLNSDGGERRLNVLITRARLRCEIFTNLAADDINSTARGVVALKRYLQYAQDGQMDIPMASEREADSPFEEVVAVALRQHGYEVVHQVGSAGFFIDLAIVDAKRPGRYLIGIECDGASYHSARSARDRDRLRQQVLENMGWCIHRIWSTDWFRNPDRELIEVIKAIEVAKGQSLQRDIVENTPKEHQPSEAVALERVDTGIQPTEALAQGYIIAELQIGSYQIGLHEVSELKLAEWVQQVVEVESPVHFNEVARRIVDAFGVKRIGGRIREALQRATRSAVREKRIERRGNFLWRVGMEEPQYVRSHERIPNYSRKIDQIAPEEIMLAIEIVLTHSLGMQKEEIPSATASLLGYKRTGNDIKVHVDKLVGKMLSEKQLIQTGDFLIMAQNK